MGDRSLSMPEPKLWNSLPVEIQQSATLSRLRNVVARHLTSLWMKGE
jgi:hypothetical protein